MPPAPVRIETVTAATVELVLPLLAAYQRFYRAEPDEQRNRAHLSALVADPSLGIQFIALGPAAAPVGFATLYYPLSSVHAKRYCLLNDLYTVPQARGHGVGRALVEHCLRQARARGYAAMSWTTQLTNTAAQGLYDSLGATKEAWLEYTLPTAA